MKIERIDPCSVPLTMTGPQKALHKCLLLLLIKKKTIRMPEMPSSKECSPWNLIWVRTLASPHTSKTLDNSYDLYEPQCPHL